METLKIGIQVFKRVISFVTIVALFLIKALFIFLRTGNFLSRRRLFILNSTKHAKMMCNAFEIKVNVVNPLDPNQNGLLVGNHMGFVDILAVYSFMPSLFVTSLEMRNTLFLGTLTEAAGCIFVDRKNRARILTELQEMITALRDGFRIVIFPEATSHNGEEVLPFKRTLISSAAHAKVPIIPYCFNYKAVERKPFSLKNRDSVCWYGDQTFLSSAIHLFFISSVEVEIEFLPFIYATPEDDRAVIADTVREKIVAKFLPVIEKRNRTHLNNSGTVTEEAR